MIDATENFGNSRIEHGPVHDRAYLKRLDTADLPQITEVLEQLACSRGYSKVSALIPASGAAHFVAAGYYMEAAIPGFSSGGGAACFMAKYFSTERSEEQLPLLVRDVLAAALARQRAAVVPTPAGVSVRAVAAADAEAVAELYRNLFTDEPVPGIAAAHIRRAFAADTVSIGGWEEKTLVGVISAEIDEETNSAEVASFVLVPQHRCGMLPLHLLQRLEQLLVEHGCRFAFATVRACSFAVNNTLSENGYLFGGTLTNNSSIQGRFESTNVWYKELEQDPVRAWSSVVSR